MRPAWQRQHDYEIRCEWGSEGVAALSAHCDAVVIVDVLSFCTAVDIATARGARVYPWPRHDDASVSLAAEASARIANRDRRAPGFTLSPASLRTIPPAARLVLPSPNGATLSLGTGAVPTFAGCLRNAQAVATAAARLGNRVAVIPAGERWGDGSTRFAWEDLVGAGAVIRHLRGSRSPEASAAESAFVAAEPHLTSLMRGCLSGRELIERGFSEDVALASDVNASVAAPRLRDGFYEDRRIRIGYDAENDGD